MKIFNGRIITFLFAAASVISCVKPTFGKDATCAVFLPGECLAGTKLTELEKQRISLGQYQFWFSMDLSAHVLEDVSFWEHRKYDVYAREVPSDEAYQVFGKQKSSVKKAFDATFDSFSENFFQATGRGDFSVVTLLYNGGISLVADKDFAGVPAGGNLGPLLKSLFGSGATETVIAESRNAKDVCGQYLELPFDFVCVTGKMINFYIPVDEFEVVDDPVQFKLEIPVRVVYYLHWLNDKLENPNAPCPYEDVVLHCTFTNPERLI